MRKIQKLNFLLVTLMIVAMVLGVFTAGAKVDLPDVMITSEATSGDNVAKVGNTEYASIDEAIANWTNGTTLTLLRDVTLSDVITLKSTEHHILNLGTYTMTAASGKNAIVIQACGTGDAERTAITIKADATNPGGINAGNKCVIYYKYADGGISGTDRPIIKIEGGVFTGSTSSWGTAGIYTIGSEARKCATLNISGGTFNCSINGTTKSKLIISGGTFNYSVGSTGDSTAIRQITGGKFKSFGFMTNDNKNGKYNKFTIGSGMEVYDVGVYIDKEGYLVVGGPVITELSEKYQAVANNCSKWSSHLMQSSAATYGLYYEDPAMAIKKHGEANVTIWEKPAVTIPEDVTGDATVVEEIKNNTALKDYTPENLPTDATLEIELKSVGETFVYDVTPMANGTKVEPTEAITFRLPVPASVTKAYAKVYHEGTLMGIYEIKGEGNAKYVEVSSADFSEFAVEPITHYEVSTYEELIAALANDNAYVVMKNDITATATQSSGYGKAGIVIDAGDVLDGKGYKLTIKGAGDTWDCAIAMRGGEVKNLTIAGAMRGVFMPGATGDVVIDNCVFENVIYTFNSDAGSKNHTVTIKNTTINGWTSFSDAHEAVTFENCKFGEGSGYAFCRPYQATTFIGCEFESGYEFDTTQVVENGLAFNDCKYDGEALSANNSDMFCDGGKVMINGVSVSLDFVAAIGDKKYVSIADAIAALKSGDEIVLLADVTGDITVPHGVIFNGNGFTVDGIIFADGDITFKNVTKANDLDFNVSNITVNIGEGASLQLVGANRMSIGFGITFNITGTITDAKTADKADITPSLIIPGASFTGAGVTFNVTNAYIKAPSSYCSSSKSASGTFTFNITNSIFETAGKLAFEAQSVSATVNFYLKDSVLTTGSHLLFSVTKGEIVIDNSNVNVGTSRQLENCSTMTIKNGSVVNGAVATSSNAKNPGTIIVENATYAVTGEFSGSDLGTGTLVIKKGANISIGSVTKANITIDATDMTEGELANFTANLSKFAGTLSVINNDKLEASLVDGKIVLAKKAVAQIGDTKYYTLAEAFAAAQNGQTITLLANIIIDTETFTVADGVAITLDMNGKKITVTDNSTTNYELFYIYGEMTVTGNGTIEITATNNRAWNASSGIFHNRGGKLTVVNGKFTHNGGTDMAFVIDNSGNWYGDAYTTINGGTITSTYIAIRNRMEQNTHGSSGTAFIVVNGGTINGTSRAIWAQAASTSTISPATGLITINAGTVGLIDTARSAGAQSMTIINGGSVAKFKGEVCELTVEGGTLGEATILTADGTEVAYAVNAEGLYVQAVASINGVAYATLAEALEAAQAGDTITLLADIEISETIIVAKNITLNLNGKKITSTAQYWVIKIEGNSVLTLVGNGTLEGNEGISVTKGSELIMNGGTIIANDADGTAIQLFGSKATMNGGTLISKNNGVKIFGDNAVWASFIMNGGEINTEESSIMANGTERYDNVEVTINAGKISSSGNNCAGIFWPAEGKLTITGGEISGEDAIYMKSGSLVINGGTLIGNGAKVDYVSKGSGFDSTGDALVIENIGNSGYEAVGNVSITGGTFISENAAAVGCYAADGATVKTGFITGGTFNTDVSAFCADGFKAKDNGNGTFGVVSTKLYIYTLADLKAFRDAVNSGSNYYAGVTVYLMADIDLAGENWIPIGSAYKDHGFMGNFDGNGFKIKNLTINNPAVDSDGYAYAGFFGVTEGTDKDNQNTIKNLIIENVTIKTTGHIVAAAIAYPYYTIVDNVTVCGNIAIEGGDYTAGALAYTRRCVNASNVTVSGNAGSYIKGKQVVGGVISDIQMNGGLTANYSNFSASGLTITGEKMVGGISGIIASQTLNGATVKNVTLVCSDSRVGVVAGSLGGASTIANVTVETVTGATAIVGGTYDGGTAVQAKVGDTYYATLQDAIAAAQADDTITLLADVTIDELIKIEKNITIDLNGHKVTATSQKAFEIYANVTIKNGTIKAAQRCVDTRKAVELTLTDVTLIADKYTSYGNPQPLTIGGSENGTKVTMTNVNISAKAGYGIITFVKTELTATKSTIGGYNALYVKPGSEYSTFNFVDCDLVGSTESNDVVGNSFSTIAVRANNVTVDVDADSTITAKGNYCWAISMDSSFTGETGSTGAKITVAGTIIGQVVESVDASKNTVTLNAEYADEVTAAGYAYVTNNDGTITLAKAVAKIGDNYYATLAEAFAAAKDGETVKLIADVTLETSASNGAFEIKVGRKITLDLNGYNITAGAREGYTGRTQYVFDNYADLTITGKGVITSRGIQNYGTLTINSADVKIVTVDAKGGACVYGYEGSVTNISAGTFENKGGNNALIETAGKLYVTGGTFTQSGNGASYAIIVKDEATFADATITGAHGAIGAIGNAKVTITSGTYTLVGVAGQSDHCIYASTNATVTITGGTFTSKEHDAGGKTLYGEKGTIVVSGGTFDEAVAEELCAEGYVPKANSDGTYGVEKKAASNKFDIDRDNIRMGSDLSLLFAVKQSKLTSLDGVYAVITRKVADGTTVSVIVKSSNELMWTTTTIDNEKYYVIEFSGIAAKEMADEVTIVIMDADDNELSNVYTSSLRQYAMKKLETSRNAEFKVALVDMLNFGAIAQQYFKYNTKDLANSQLSDEQKALASVEGTYSDDNKVVDETYYNATNLRFVSKINLLFRMNIPYETYAVFTWTDHKGNGHAVRFDNDKYTTSSGMYVLELDQLVVADARCMVTCTVYNIADDSVVTVVVDSAEGEVASTSDTSAVKALYIAYMKFADSAYKYLH